MIWLLLLMVLELDIVVYMFYYLRLDVKVDCVKLVTLRVMCGLGMCRWDEGGVVRMSGLLRACLENGGRAEELV